MEMISRSPKLPSPPISRRESNFGSQAAIDRAQSDYFTQVHGHSGWMDNHQNLQGRSAIGSGVRSYHSPMGGLSHSIAGTLDPFSTDLSVPPSQLSYTGGYVSGQVTPTQYHDLKREY